MFELSVDGPVFARDEGGNEGMSEAREIRLPERPFTKLLARALIEQRYSSGGFVRLQADTLEALRRRRAELGLATFDATIAEALQR